MLSAPWSGAVCLQISLPVPSSAQTALRMSALCHRASHVGGDGAQFWLGPSTCMSALWLFFLSSQGCCVGPAVALGSVLRVALGGKFCSQGSSFLTYLEVDQFCNSTEKFLLLLSHVMGTRKRKYTQADFTVAP